MIWNFDSAKCRWHIVALWSLNGSGLRLGMELLIHNIISAWSECDLDSAHIFFVGVTVSSKLTDWHRLPACQIQENWLQSVMSCFPVALARRFSPVGLHTGGFWSSMRDPHMTPRLGQLFELFANLGCLGWSAASRVCCMWQQHMWFRANSTYWKIVVAGKPAQPGLFQEETIWSLRHSGSSALDTFAPTWKIQDFGQIVYLSSTQRSVGLCLSANDN